MQADFTGAGWSYPLGVARSGTVALSTGTERLEQAMRIILATYPGERPMRPLFGCRLRDFQFECVTPENATAIATEVTRAMDACETRVEVTGVDVVPVVADLGMYSIEIHYVVLDTNHERNLVVPFYSIPGETLPVGER